MSECSSDASSDASSACAGNDEIMASFCRPKSPEPTLPGDVTKQHHHLDGHSCTTALEGDPGDPHPLKLDAFVALDKGEQAQPAGARGEQGQVAPHNGDCCPIRHFHLIKASRDTTALEALKEAGKAFMDALAKSAKATAKAAGNPLLVSVVDDKWKPTEPAATESDTAALGTSAAATGTDSSKKEEEMGVGSNKGRRRARRHRRLFLINANNALTISHNHALRQRDPCLRNASRPASTRRKLPPRL